VGNTITDAILGAWDEEEEAPTAESEGTEPDATTPDGDEVRDEVPSGDVDVDETEPEEEEEPAEEEEQDEVVVPDEEEEPAPEPVEEEEEEPSGDEEPSTTETGDPETQAFVDRYGGVEAALRRGAFLERTVGRQGQELGQLRAQVAELSAQLEQAELFSHTSHFVSPEQAQWLEEAVGSEQPAAYIQSAVEAGEFDLARAVLEQGEFPTAQVVRLSRAIDVAESRAAPQEPSIEELPLDHGALMNVLVQHYPEMPKFEAEMVSTLQGLGYDHPLAALSRSSDPGEAAQGIIGLYEIARAKTATVASTRDGVKKKSRQAADDARRSAVVSSAQATPSQTQSPRQKPLMPGLTWEALEAEFDTE
jgi:hypothetical protein